MKEYKPVSHVAPQKLVGHVNPLYSRYSRYAHPSDREMLSTPYNTPEKRDPYYYRKPHPRRNLDYGDGIPPGTGYPELKPVGSYI